jgi:phosphoribosylformimino-5-aminoimidazole carboxamide ribotide isomerase
MLGPGNDEAALSALRAYPLGLQIGGGITATNALQYLEAGAAQIIVTSYVFQDGVVQFDRLEELLALVGKDRLVIDLSCRCKPGTDDGLYYVVTNKWTKFTDFPLTCVLSKFCILCSS